MLLQRLVEYLAPAECLMCGQEGALICSECQDQAIITKTPTCYRCNRLSTGWKVCATCRHYTQLLRVVVASHYDGSVQEVIKALKYRQAVAAGDIAAAWLAPKLHASEFDLVIPVPSAPGRERQRGYNQAAVIARSLAQQLDLPYLVTLGRTGETHQVGRSRAERLQQLKGAFYIRNRALLEQAHVLLVDDVVTTGATLSECATVLKQAGAKHVSGAVIAKH